MEDVPGRSSGHLVPLLAELVVALGDETCDVAQQARILNITYRPYLMTSLQGIIALKKVEQILKQGRRDSPSQSDLGLFLKTYMLGLISDINDMLQDVQGKKSVVAKKKILRSLGALVQQIGPMINHVSPQVCLAQLK